MKKLAINSFLAVTAMAWLGQADADQSLSESSRDTAEASASSLHQTLSSEEIGARAAHARHAPWLFSNDQRARLKAWLAQQLPGHHSRDPAPPALAPGMQLTFEHLRQGRVLPAEVSAMAREHAPLLVDVVLHGRVVRLFRDNREVIDLV